MDETTDDIPWQPFPREWWIETARELGARNDRFAKYAACRFNGMNQKTSAQRAGYSEERAAKAGSETERKPIVQKLLDLARAKAKADGVDEPRGQFVTREELKTRLSESIRGGTHSERIRAGELYEKLYLAEERPKTSNEDGFAEWRAARNFLKAPRGATAFCLLWHGTSRSLSSLPMFADISAQARREEPAIWQMLVERHSDVMKQDLREREGDPDWQREARQQLWSEVGIPIEEADRRAFANPNGVAKPTPEDNQQKQTVAA